MTNVQDPNYGILTDEAFEKSRMRIGIPARRSTVPHNFEVTWDAIRHFAYGYGDDNPLYWIDPLGDQLSYLLPHLASLCEADVWVGTD